MHNILVFLVISAVANFFGWSHVTGSQLPRIRGIPISKNSLYAADRDFECFDGSLLIPFTRINDDYCDCADGSDEPGTSACMNGSFYCQNAGHQSMYIPSVWVNDGVCDCCDASDEYASGKACVDNCHELGQEARLEAQRTVELAREGNKIRLEMLTRGKQIKTELQTRLVKLRADYEEADLTKKEKEILKTQAEERESAALEKYKPIESEERVVHTEEEEEQEIQESEAEDYFKMLDLDNSGTVTIAEIQAKVTFDKNKDGVVSVEEAMFFLNNQKEITFEEFLNFAWANIKPFLMLEQGIFKPTDQEDKEASSEDIEGSLEYGKDENEGTDDDGVHQDEHKEAEQPEIQYDEETQAVINEANAARERFKQIEKAVHDLQTEIGKVEEKIDRDYGPEEEFAPLDGECFEYADLEYVYSLCLFGKASQRSKSGGSDISLGHWHEWIGPEGNKYSVMKYDRGLTCWNGPARLTIVTLTCGKENELLSVSEPSRCEYAMEFATPALCNPNVLNSDQHDEL